MRMMNIKYISWGVILLGLLAGCKDDDEKGTVMPEPELTLSGTDLVFEQAGGVKSFHLATNRGWAVNRNEGDWLAVEGEAIGEPGEYTVALKAQANHNPQSRKAKFTVNAGPKAEVVEFTQFGSEPEVIAAFQQLKVNCDGGMYDMIIHTNATPLTGNSLASWLSIGKGPYQSASYQYEIQVFPNTEAKARTGQVIFNVEGAADTITVEQEAYSPRLEVVENKLSVSALASAAKLTFKANTDWTFEWLGQGKPAWVSVVSPLEGKAREEIDLQFTISSNIETEDAPARSAAFRINYGATYQDFTLAQAAPVISAIGTRETDSLALVALYNGIQGVKPDWDLALPLEKWGPRSIADGTVVPSVSLSPAGRVIGLVLQGFTIEGQLPEALGDLLLLRKLEFLVITPKNMSFPASFAKLTQLQEFGISVSKEGGKVILPDLRSHEALHTFDILGQDTYYGAETPEFTNIEFTAAPHLTDYRVTRANVGGKLPDMSGCDRLKDLYVVVSDLTEFPQGLEQLSTLGTLTLSSCQIEGGLPDVFSGTGLTSIDISDNKMSGPLPVYLFTSDKLLAAWISNNEFTGNLPVEMSTRSKLNQFSCRLNKLGGADYNMLPVEILQDSRWQGVIIGGGSSGSGGWNGSINICEQQPDYGWINCK